ncbi:MAG: redoxin domain-containing protein [Ilumatobacteraceae bacterium]
MRRRRRRPRLDFTLPGTGGREYSLSDSPASRWCSCSTRRRHAGVHQAAQRHNDGLDRFEELDAQIVGISAQSVESKEAFSGKHGFEFLLLADTDKAVAGAYGTLGPIGFPAGASIVDADGVIRYVHKAMAGLTYRPVSELIDELEKAR